MSNFKFTIGRCSLLLGFVILGMTLASNDVSAQSEGSKMEFSLSGGDSISHSFNLNVGDNLSVTYSITASNETTCVEVSGSFEPTFSLFGASKYYNQTSIAPYKAYKNQHSFPINMTGTLTITYSSCPNVPTCKGDVSVNATYDMRLATTQNSDIWDVIGPIALIVAGVLVTVLVGVYILYARKRPSQGTGANPSVPIRF